MGQGKLNKLLFNIANYRIQDKSMGKERCPVEEKGTQVIPRDILHRGKPSEIAQVGGFLAGYEKVTKYVPATFVL